MEIKRIDLPSGGWWDLMCKPTWREFREIQAKLQAIAGKPDFEEQSLAIFTSAWSFDKPITDDYISSLDALDVAKAMEFMATEIAPFFIQANSSLSLKSSS